MNLGLVMGGGGLVGIAWELGVLAALQESVGFDPTSAAVIVGTSAGSVAGAEAALGRDLRVLVHRQLSTAAGAAEPSAACGNRVRHAARHHPSDDVGKGHRRGASDRDRQAGDGCRGGGER